MLHTITRHDLEFDRVPVRFFSTSGVPQVRWERVGMPRIPQNVIKGVFYLYRDASDAKAGKDPGGTGFVVRYDGTLHESVPGHHFYGVTNWHVAVAGGYSTIRFNAKDGGTDIIELGPEDWHFMPGKHDVAVVSLTLDEKVHDVSSVSTHEFAQINGGLQLDGNRVYTSPGFGVGEDVFMVGLFIDHAGVATNVPSARFGNISMLPNPSATIKQPTGYHGAGYVVDMHSRTGFSGSPVYVFRTFGSDLTRAGGHDFEMIELDNAQIEGTYGNKMRARGGRIRANSLFKLLGIHWGQFPERWELGDRSRLKESRKDLILEGRYVEGMSGMTCVIPAWDIMEVLNMPELKTQRHPEMAAAIEAEKKNPRPEAAVPAAKDENPQHLEDFKTLLGAAARKTPQGG